MNDHASRRRHPAVIIVFMTTALILLVGLFLSVRLGPWDISPGDIIQVLAAKLLGIGSAPDPATEAIIWYGRVPRTLTGALVGFSLGCAGTIMQGIFKNPMASPGVIGTSSGAALGAVTAIYFGLAASNIYAVPAFAMLFAFLSMLIVLLIATTGGLTSRYTLLLAGIAFNAIFSALITYRSIDGPVRHGPQDRWLADGRFDQPLLGTRTDRADYRPARFPGVNALCPRPQYHHA